MLWDTTQSVCLYLLIGLVFALGAYWQRRKYNVPADHDLVSIIVINLFYPILVSWFVGRKLWLKICYWYWRCVNKSHSKKVLHKFAELRQCLERMPDGEEKNVLLRKMEENMRRIEFMWDNRLSRDELLKIIHQSTAICQELSEAFSKKT